MANKTYAKEWLVFAMKNLNTAKLLYEANHYEDIIGIELQQVLEKVLKSMQNGILNKFGKKSGYSCFNLWQVRSIYMSYKENNHKKFEVTMYSFRGKQPN